VKRYRNKKKRRNKKRNGIQDVERTKGRRRGNRCYEAQVEKFRGNNRDTLDIKTWCLQVSRLDPVNKLGNMNTAIIVMEALREQALSWALLLQDKKPASAASWLLLKPLLLERFDKVVNETQKFKLIAALQQRQNENSKDFLDRCKTAWYGLLRKLEDEVHGEDGDGHA
jgi:hypothetical protein